MPDAEATTQTSTAPTSRKSSTSKGKERAADTPRDFGSGGGDDNSNGKNNNNNNEKNDGKNDKPDLPEVDDGWGEGKHYKLSSSKKSPGYPLVGGQVYTWPRPAPGPDAERDL